MPVAEFVRQISLLMSLPTVLVLGAAACIIVVARDWRMILLAYGLYSVALAVMLSQLIPPEWALMQAIVGGLIGVILFLSGRQLRDVRTPRLGVEGRWPHMVSLSSFRLMAVALAASAFFLLHESIRVPMLNPLQSDAFLWIQLMGIMGLALHEEPLHAGLALLVMVGGSLLLLDQLFPQRTVIGLLDAWQLLLGLAIAYLTVSRGLAAPEQTGEEAT
jgi:uncharacterized MnhB-related membrane protein